MRSKKGPDQQHWQSAGSFWFFSSFCFSLENYIASFHKTRSNKFDSFPYKLLKKYLVLIFCRSKIVSKKDTICRNITFNKLKNYILLTTLTSSPHFSASDGLSILTRGIPSASRIWSTPCTIYSVTPCTIYGVTPCTVYGVTPCTIYSVTPCTLDIEIPCTIYSVTPCTIYSVTCCIIYSVTPCTIYSVTPCTIYSLTPFTIYSVTCCTIYRVTPCTLYSVTPCTIYSVTSYLQCVLCETP